MKLRAALEAMLAGWRADLPTAWRAILSDTELNFDSRALDYAMRRGEIVIPGRKRAPLPGAPEGAHVFRAFDRVDPARVRAVILGQDPYPNPRWATGRAFEQGDLAEWPEKSGAFAASLRRIAQVLAAARTGNAAYARDDRAWKDVLREVNLEPPRELFDRLEREGVLFLNASLTLSLVIGAREKKEPRGHFPLWEPFTNRVLSFVAGARDVVFLLWGRHACEIFERSGAPQAAAVRHAHPAAITREGAAFLKPPNPFLAANELLARMGAAPISW